MKQVFASICIAMFAMHAQADPALAKGSTELVKIKFETCVLARSNVLRAAKLGGEMLRTTMADFDRCKSTALDEVKAGHQKIKAAATKDSQRNAADDWRIEWSSVFEGLDPLSPRSSPSQAIRAGEKLKMEFE